MDNDSKFWLSIWGIIGVVVLGSTALIGGCVYKNSELALSVVNNAVQKGLDPLVAKCAMLVGSANISAAETAICLSVTNKK